jgi:hypothetical protein
MLASRGFTSLITDSERYALHKPYLPLYSGMVFAVPNLSPDDQALLTAYIVYRFNLIELANYTERPLLDLKDWVLQPHIQAQISQYLRLEALQHKTETADARSAGINELMSLLGTSEDPIERRRAAQALIRVGSPQPTRKPTAEPQPAPPPPTDTRFGSDPGQDVDPDPDLDLDEDLEDRLEESPLVPFVPSVPSPAPQAPEPRAVGTGASPLHEREWRKSEQSVSAEPAQAPRATAEPLTVPTFVHSDTS